MPSYKTHKFFNYVVVFPIICGILYFLNQWSYSVGILLLLGFYLGTNWITPDLDTNSAPSNKNRIWRILWTPYRWIMPHRGDSHKIAVGFIGRMLYLNIIIGLLAYLLIPVPWYSLIWQAVTTPELFVMISLVMFGIMIANAGHIVLDRIATRFKRAF